MSTSSSVSRTPAPPADAAHPRDTAERARHIAGLIAALSLLVVSTSVWAADGAPQVIVPDAKAEAPLAAARWQGATPARSTIDVDVRQTGPRWSALEGAPAVPPAAESPLTRMRVVRWAQLGGASSLGLSMGVSNASGAAFTSLNPGAPSNRAVPEFGLRWRTQWNSERRIDVDAWRSYDPTAPTPDQRQTYNARVELQFMNSKVKGLDLPHGAFGLQMSANSQMVLRARHGGPMIYYRRRFF
jgi:hypothetical protein